MGNKILKTYIQITTFLIYLLIIFGLCRIGFIINSGILNSAITGAYGSASLPFLDIMQTLFSGLRYDGRLAAPAAFIFAVLYIAFSFINLILSALFVFFKDIQYLYDIFTLALMYFTPIFYEVSIFEGSIALKLLNLNPLYLYIDYIRQVVLYQQIPSLTFHLMCLLYALVLLRIGMGMYKKYNYMFLYYL